MGTVYILTNDAMPGLVKIGRTDDGDVTARVRHINAASGVPLPFEVFYAASVENSIGWERALHEAFADRRINPRREFFRVSPDKPLAILRMAEIQGQRLAIPNLEELVEHQEEVLAVNEERIRRSPFNFESVNIPIGSELLSVFDENISATVYDSRRILYNNVVKSLSESARDVARMTGRNWRAVQGPAYWLYNGRTLSEIREEIETRE
ncbi:GIY-YIG nuclease family protein [Asticcacaulis sp.]|uniref:GIY-YIG nuclease family protein n=1 Tax=Asticcacaulis sp. TaxID=1872648 RepID=UPI00262502C2|nr:GIY-YIG nuclease family protein [Asticcacaulis sp.]